MFFVLLLGHGFDLSALLLSWHNRLSMVVTAVRVVRAVMAKACQLNEAQILLVPVLACQLHRVLNPKRRTLIRVSR